MLASLRRFGVVAILLAIPSPARTADEPATVAEATRALDLSTFPVIPGGVLGGPRRLAHLAYNARGATQEAYSFQKKTLEERGWKEAPGSYLSDQACSGSFVKDDYTVSVSVTPSSSSESAGLVDVSLSNHGNVDVSKLPVPTDAKPLYSFPAVTAYVTAATVEETAMDLRELLMSRGWEPYGRAGDSLFFKKNAVRITAFTSVAPAQGGKTVIQLSAELMSADLPSPADAIGVAYADVTKALSLEVEMTPDELTTYYKEALGKAGWKATTERASKIDFRDLLIFRNDAKDILTLKMHETQGKLRADLEHRTATEFEEELRLARDAEAKRKADAEKQAKMAAEKEARNRVKVVIALPVGAMEVDRSADQVEFKLTAGKAIGAVRAIQAALVKGGWNGPAAKLEPMAGSISMEKGTGSRLVIVYVDTGFGDAEVRISSFGAEIEDPDAK